MNISGKILKLHVRGKYMRRNKLIIYKQGDYVTFSAQQNNI